MVFGGIMWDGMMPQGFFRVHEAYTDPALRDPQVRKPESKYFRWSISI
jgi:hypothetical protein